MSISVIIAYFLYSAVNPDFNTTSYAVSDLGTGPNMSNIVYNIGATVTGFCLAFLHLSLVSYLRDKKPNSYLIKITKLLSVISAIGLIVLGIIPFERENLFLFLGHGTAAATHYVAGSIAFIFYGVFEIIILKFSKILGLISFLTGIIYGSLWIGYLINYTFRIPREYANYILQWISLGGILLWSLVHSLFIILIKKKSAFNGK
ncbi:MAG: DUF998 domain-containing protein [Candidatus Hermodarchaeota archaeon]